MKWRSSGQKSEGTGITVGHIAIFHNNLKLGKNREQPQELRANIIFT